MMGSQVCLLAGECGQGCIPRYGTRCLFTLYWHSARLYSAPTPPSAVTRPDQENEVEADASGLQHQPLRQHATRHYVIPVVQIINKPVTVATPLLYPITMLQIVHFRIAC